MTDKELNLVLLEEIPEVRTKFDVLIPNDEEYFDEGCTITYEHLFAPLVMDAINDSDDDNLERYGRFIEQVLSFHDESGDAAMYTGLLERVFYESDIERLAPYLGLLGNKAITEIVSWHTKQH